MMPPDHDGPRNGTPSDLDPATLLYFAGYLSMQLRESRSLTDPERFACRVLYDAQTQTMAQLSDLPHPDQDLLWEFTALLQQQEQALEMAAERCD